MNGVSASADATVIMAIPSFHLFQNGPVSYVKIVNSNQTNCICKYKVYFYMIV